jgi:hypothetical protein
MKLGNRLNGLQNDAEIETVKTVPESVSPTVPPG